MIRMPNMTRDPLLIAAQAIIIFVSSVLCIAAVALAFAAAYVAINPSGLTVELVREGFANPGSGVANAILAMMLMGLAAIALAFLFFANLSRIIESVAAGDPFAPVNATRLARMAWRMVGIQAIAVPAGMLGVWLGERMSGVDVGFGLSGAGLVMALTLFILARVFRHGAAMRADLEGTV